MATRTNVSKRARLDAIGGYLESGYVALLELRFDWKLSEIAAVESMWNEGLSVKTIAGVVKRDPDEVVILIMDRARKGKIKRRRSGLIGEGEEK